MEIRCLVTLSHTIRTFPHGARDCVSCYVVLLLLLVCEVFSCFFFFCPAQFTTTTIAILLTKHRGSTVLKYTYQKWGLCFSNCRLKVSKSITSSKVSLEAHSQNRIYHRYSQSVFLLGMCFLALIRTPPHLTLNTAILPGALLLLSGCFPITILLFLSYAPYVYQLV